MQRAFSLLTVKEVDDSRRVIRGIASTPTVDRAGDVVEPLGAKFKVPMPLLLYHDSKKPVGTVDFAKPTKDGIPFEASLPNVTEPGTVRDRVEEALHSLKYKLLGAVSIGFNPLPDGYELMKSGGLRFTAWEWLELTLCSVPANPDAVIQGFKSMDPREIHRVLGTHPSDSAAERAALIKSLDTQQRAASGAVVRLIPPGVSGKANPETPKGKKMNFAEQIAAAQAKREAAKQKMVDLMTAATEGGTTLDEHGDEEFKQAEAEVKSLDEHVARLKAVEAISVAKATPVVQDAGAIEAKATDLRGGNVISVRRNLPPGIPFARFAIAQAVAKGNIMVAEKVAERWKDTPEVVNCLKAAAYFGGTQDFALNVKAAVAAGNTTDSAWAAPLVQYNNMASEFVGLVRNAAILGKLTKLRHVPFNIRIPRQTGGVSGQFVGEGAPKPVGKLSFDNVALPWAKAAVIVVFSAELSRFSDPSVEALVRDDMVKGIAQYLDDRLVNPAYAGVSGVSPASLTNGITAHASTGATIAAITSDVGALLGGFATANLDLTAGAWIMNPNTALKLSLVRNSQDAFEFPKIGINGGEWFGLPVITSNTVPVSVIALVDQSEVLIADDGDVSIDMSQEASVQMTDTPSGGATSLVSLWQNNLTGLRAERFIYWMPRRAAAVAVMTDVAY
jgi:HK97 family phage major capsid protein